MSNTGKQPLYASNDVLFWIPSYLNPRMWKLQIQGTNYNIDDRVR